MSSVYSEESEKSSINENEGYNDSELDELDGFLNEQQANVKRYSELLQLKYITVIDFNRGDLDADLYFYTLNKINTELEYIDYTDTETNHALIEQEIRFQTLLDEYIQKIETIRKVRKKQTKEYLDYFEIQRLNAINYVIKEIQQKYIPQEEEEVIENPSIDLLELFQSRKEDLNKIARIKNMTIPDRSLFSSDSEFAEAEFQFYEKIYFLLPGVPTGFEQFEDKERKEMDSLAKRLKIRIPKGGNIDQFYREVSQLLPGYNFVMKTTSIGHSYELLDIVSLKEKIQNDIKLLEELPIRLSTEEFQTGKNKKILSSILGKIEKNKLIDCITGSNVKINKKTVEPDKVQKGKTIYLKGLMSEKIQTHSMTPEEKLNHSNMIQHKKLLVEMLEKYYIFEQKKVLKKNKNVPLKIERSVPLNILPGLRKISTLRLINSLERGTPIELKIYIQPIIEKMELYILKISNNNFINYSNKIEDILFIFDNYSSFKLKLLKSELNIYQIVLFEKELSLEAHLHVYPVNIENRKIILKQIRAECNSLKIVILKSKILTNVVIEQKSKIFELMIFNMSDNKSDYLYNARKLIELISSKGKAVLTGDVPIMETIQTQKISEKKTRESTKEWLELPKDDSRSYNEFIKKIDNSKYTEYSLKQLTSMIAIEEELLNGHHGIKFEKVMLESKYIDPVKNFISQDEQIKLNLMISKLNSKNPKTDYKIIKILKNEITMFKQFIIKKNNKNDSEQYNILAKQVIETEEKIVQLTNIYRIKKEEEYNLKREKCISTLQIKYSEPVPILTEYQMINEQMISQVIQAFKRKLILTDPTIIKKISTIKTVKIDLHGIVMADYDYLPDHIKYPSFQVTEYQVTTPEYFDRSDATKRGNLIGYFELHDLNEYYYSIKQIPDELYLKLKRAFVSYIDNYIDFKSVNTIFIKKAMDYFNTEQTDTIKQRLELITKKWPKNYTPQNTIVDFWGRDLFEQLLQSKDPIDFYNTMIIKNYQVFIKNLTPKGVQLFRKPGILFNEKTGKFGNEAYDGRLFEVQFLDKDFTTQQPFIQTKVINEKDPRTGTWIPVNVKTQKRGPYAFILRHVGTNQIGESREIWTEIPKGSVKLYTLDYDACSRFTKEPDCKGPGMNELKCGWVNKTCKSLFGKSVLRRRVIKKQIKFKHKKKYLIK
jgi:hypothetical protein